MNIELTDNEIKMMVQQRINSYVDNVVVRSEIMNKLEQQVYYKLSQIMLDEFISMTKEAIRKVLPDLFRNVLEDYTADEGEEHG